jgi:hypothetical protein
MRSFLLLTTLTFHHAFAYASVLTGTVYDKDSNKKTVLFDWERFEEGDAANRKVKLVYTTPERQPAVIEEFQYENGKIKRYTVDHKQTSESGTLDIRDGKLFFSYTKDGKTETDDEKYPEKDNLVLTGTMCDYVAAHKDTILKGDNVEARFVVLHRKETVGFKFFKISEGVQDGHEVVTVKMKPTSIIIAAIVDPLFITFRKDTFQVDEIVGRTMPKKQVDGRWKDLDADTVFHFKGTKS